MDEDELKQMRIDRAWAFHLDAMMALAEALEEDDKELEQILNFIRYQKNRAQA